MPTGLALIWDEPGGCYDHVPPGPAQAPDDGRSPKPGQNGFVFDRYGARVPALLVSPYVAPESWRPPGRCPSTTRRSSGPSASDSRQPPGR